MVGCAVDIVNEHCGRRERVSASEGVEELVRNGELAYVMAKGESASAAKGNECESASDGVC